jgi:hypothetical protein
MAISHGLVVKADGSWPRGHGFKPRHRILDGCKQIASYYIKENLKIKVAKRGTPKKILKKKIILLKAIAIRGWGTNNENINIDDRKWLTLTTFSSPRNINIEKVRRRYSSFFFLGPARCRCYSLSHLKMKKKNGNNVECHYIWGL